MSICKFYFFYLEMMYNEETAVIRLQILSLYLEMINDEEAVVVRLRGDGISGEIQNDEIVETLETKDFADVGNLVVAKVEFDERDAAVEAGQRRHPVVVQAQVSQRRQLFQDCEKNSRFE